MSTKTIIILALLAIFGPIIAWALAIIVLAGVGLAYLNMLG